MSVSKNSSSNDNSDAVITSSSENSPVSKKSLPDENRVTDLITPNNPGDVDMEYIDEPRQLENRSDVKNQGKEEEKQDECQSGNSEVDEATSSSESSQMEQDNDDGADWQIAGGKKSKRNTGPMGKKLV